MKLLNNVSPINRQHPLNRGLLRWWLTLPQKHGGGRWRELTGKSNATITGATATSARLRPGGWGCYQYDGTDDYGQTSSIDLSGISTMTVACWCYWDAFSNNDDFLFESSPTASSNIGGVVVDLNLASGVSLVRVNTNGANNNSYTFVRPTGAAWHHYVFCFDRNGGAQQIAAVYIDGVSQTLTSTATNITSTGGFGNWQWQFMSRNGTTLFGAGKLDDFSIRNRILTAGEAKALYNESRAGYPNAIRWLPGMPNWYAEQAASANTSTLLYPPRRRMEYPMAVIQSSSEGMSSLATAVGFTTLPGRAVAARVSVTGSGTVRYRDDGGTPTTTVGHPASTLSYFWILGRQQLENFKVIEEASSALYVTYFDNLNDAG